MLQKFRQIFPENWPVFSPKDKIGDWLEFYTKVMELNYWGSTLAKSASYDPVAKEWTVVVDRDGQEVVLKPKQLVLATGMSGKANVPVIPGQDIFRGEQQHSSQHPGPDGARPVDQPRGARVEVRRGENPVRLARLSRQPFADRLVAKFHLPVKGWRGVRGAL